MARAERSRKIEATILQALATKGQAEAARFMGVSESKVSRLKSEDLALISDLLTALELKVVPLEMQCYRPEDIASVTHLARLYLNQVESPEQLQWD